MAEENGTATPPIKPPGRELGLEAVYEIAALMQTIVQMSPLTDATDQRPLVVRGLALRAHQLNSVLMSILSEDDLADDDIGSLRRKVVGEVVE